MDNYCYDSHTITTKLIEMAVRKAIDQQVTKRAFFEVRTLSNRVEVTLQNADQIFKTFDSLTANINGAPYQFVKGGPDIIQIPKAEAYVVGNRTRYNAANAVAGPEHFTVTARGSGTADNRNEARNARLMNFSTNLMVVVDEVIETPPSVIANIGAKPVSHFQDTIEFELSLKEAVNVLGVEVEFEVEGAMLAGAGFEALNGFTDIAPIDWTDNGDGTWKGSVVFGAPGGYGFTAEGPVTVAKFLFSSLGLLGDASLKITKLEVSGYDPDAEKGKGNVVFFNVDIETGLAVTVLYNKYDLNKDGFVDLLDLGIMLMYVGLKETDEAWGVSKVNDSKGRPIFAKDCDVNGDGEVNMADLVELLVNFGLNV